MNLSVFISSRNNDCFVVDGNKCDSLSEIRLFLQRELEKQTLFDKNFLKIRINESFGADTTEDSYNACLDEVKNSDFIIALYNGHAGWAPAGIKMGICHAELEAGLQISNKKTAILDVSPFFELTAADLSEKQRNDEFAKYIMTLNRFSNPLKIPKKFRNNDGLKKTLLESTKNLIGNHLAKRIENSNYYYSLSASNTIGLSWKKMKYEDRARHIKNELVDLVHKSVFFKECITQEHPIPDKMAVEDAKAYTGRPFLNDQSLIKVSGKKVDENKAGPIHFIAVYESATEGQVKAMIGYPDISVIRDEFGYYVWEQNTHIQIVVLTECNTPAAIRTKYLLFENWANSSGELEKIQNRAKARWHILKSINEAKEIANRK